LETELKPQQSLNLAGKHIPFGGPMIRLDYVIWKLCYPILERLHLLPMEGFNSEDEFIAENFDLAVIGHPDA